MDKNLLRDIAKANAPVVETRVVEGSYRWDVINALAGTNNIGIELGVAAGGFSARLMQSGRFSRLFGVDVYADLHDTAQYKAALRAVGLMAPYSLLRMTFEEALDLFPDETFDFIYVDGYAHTGEEGGQTLLDWYPKLKVGGILAGDDYDWRKWPLVPWAVNHLADQIGVGISLTDVVLDDAYAKSPSWFFTKPAMDAGPVLRPNDALLTLGAMEKSAVDAKRKRGKHHK